MDRDGRGLLRRLAAVPLAALLPVLLAGAGCAGTGASPAADAARASGAAGSGASATPAAPGTATAPGGARGPGSADGGGYPAAAGAKRAVGSPVAADPHPPAGSVLAGLVRGPAPGGAAVRRAVAALVPGRVLGRRIGVLVVDPFTGATLVSRLASLPLTPASTSKLLTATALVDRYGAAHEFRTSVVMQPAGRSAVPAGSAGPAAQLVLVGGGDPSLTSAAAAPPGPVPAWSTAVRGPARLPALAAATANALRARGVTRVRVSIDDSLFTGARVDPAWPRTDVAEGYVGPVDSLTVDNGRVSVYTDRRVPDPARSAGSLLVALLRADGITVSGPVVRTVPRPGATTVAAVDSPPVAELVRHMLENSDNDYAEVLARQVAVGTAEPVTFAGAVTAVDDRLAALGIDLAGVRRYDGSGLSHLDRIEPGTLASVVALDLAVPRLGAVLRGAAVAGRAGSLLDRMGGVHGPAAGRVVAKTGTLTRVHDLAGYVIPAGGRPLIFVFMVDTARDDLAAEDLLDDAAVRLVKAGPAA